MDDKLIIYLSIIIFDNKKSLFKSMLNPRVLKPKRNKKISKK